jgi:hypothetical protein
MFGGLNLGSVADAMIKAESSILWMPPILSLPHCLDFSTVHFYNAF